MGYRLIRNCYHFMNFDDGTTSTTSFTSVSSSSFPSKYLQNANAKCKMQTIQIMRLKQSSVADDTFNNRFLTLSHQLTDAGIVYHDTNTRQVHLFMQEHEKRKPWRVIIPSKYQLTIIYTKWWLSLSHWDGSILLSYHICIKSQQLMSRITNVKGT